MRRRLQIGDIIEIETPMGLGYVQYTQNDKQMLGEMIRVLPGIYPERPESLSDLVRGKERFFIFTPLNALLRDGDVVIVGNQPIPSYAGSIKTTRIAGAPDDRSEEEKSLTISFSNAGLAYLVEAMCSAWLPEHAGGVFEGSPGRSPREHDRAVLEMLRAAGSNMALPHQITHKVFFPRTGRKGVDRSQNNAEQAAEQLKHDGFEPELEKEELGWWLLAKHQVVPTERKMKAARRFMEELSEKFGGRYAAWLPKANRG